MFNEFLPLLLNSDQLQDPATGHPFAKLPEPISQGALRRNNHKRPRDILVLFQEGDQRYGLHGLPQAHFVGKDTVDTDLVKGDQPVQTS